MKKLHFLLLLVLTVFLSVCQSHEKNNEIINIMDGSITEVSLILENGEKLNPDLNDVLISSFFISNRNEIYFIDILTATIHKYSVNKKFVASTGGFGSGPGEFAKEGHKILAYCGNDYFFAIDWYQARLQIFNLDLLLTNIISLNGIPYDLSCVGDDRLAVQYSNNSRVDIISHDGVLYKELHSNIPYDNSKELIFRHFALSVDGVQYFAYYLRPILFMVDKNGSIMKEIILTDLKFEDVQTAVRNINVMDNEMHLFYNNINPNLSEREKKVGHVFDITDGEYLYSYSVPDRINNYQIESNNRLIALEDSLRSIVLYNFRIEENE